MLELDGVRGGYRPDADILTDVTLEVDRGEVVCLIGPNGAGKSTVLKAINGLLPFVHAGTIRYRGESLRGIQPHEAMRMGICHVAQGRSVFPQMTVWENLRMGGYVLDDKSDLEEQIEYVYQFFPELETLQDNKAYTLSGGQQQMLEMGRALVVDPDLVMLDEPSIGLAPRVSQKIFEKIHELVEDGITALMVEQNAVMGLENADRGYVLDNGVVRHEGTADELLRAERVREMYLGGVPE